MGRQILVAIRKKEFKAAEKFLLSIANEHEDDAYYLILLVNVNRLLKNYDEALQLALRVKAMDTHRYLLHYNLEIVYQNIGYENDAIREFDHILSAGIPTIEKEEEAEKGNIDMWKC